MYIARGIYAVGAVALLLLLKMDNLENDGDEGKRVMLGFAAVFGLLAVFLPLLEKVGNPLPGILVVIVQVCVLCYLAFTAFIPLYGILHKAKPGRKYVLVLGTSLNGTGPSRLLEGRLLAAKAYWQANPQAHILLSGGQTEKEQIPEAQAMRQWMAEQGVPDSAVTVEMQSTTTYQNFAGSLPILKRLGYTEDMELAVATDLFHFLRCVWLAKKVGFRHLTLIPSQNGSLHCAGWFFREVLAFGKITMDGPS